MKKFDKERVLLGIAAPLLAIVAAFLITALVLAATGKEPFSAFGIMFDYGIKSDSQVYIINKATTYYLAGIAVAIGFRMNLFNIGVDGQYRLAAFFAAAVGGALTLPGIVQIPLIIITAMIVGAMWAGIAGVLKTTRGVSEVVSTIMLNFIATAIIGYLLQPGRLGHLDAAGTKVATTPSRSPRASSSSRPRRPRSTASSSSRPSRASGTGSRSPAPASASTCAPSASPTRRPRPAVSTSRRWSSPPC